jgi:aryl-alcohol dehydrogenase-like predicted oxidoreductase
MRYSILGSTGVKVSRICLGTATFGVAPTSQAADELVGAAIDVGINFVDTADVYGNMPVRTGRVPLRPLSVNPPNRSSAAPFAVVATSW